MVRAYFSYRFLWLVISPDLLTKISASSYPLSEKCFLSLSSSIVRESSMISSSFLAASWRIRVFLTVMLSKILSLRVSNNEAIYDTLKMVVLVVTGWASVLRMG